MPTYRLIGEFGHELGTLVTPAIWAEGDMIPLHHYPGPVVVVGIVESEPGDDYDGYLIVRPPEQ